MNVNVKVTILMDPPGNPETRTAAEWAAKYAGAAPTLISTTDW